MKSTSHSKKFIIKKLKYEYYNNPIIDLIKYFNQEELNILKKLEVIIEDKLYTESEFDRINSKVLKYYEHSENGEIVQTSILTNKNINKEDLDKILNKFNKVALDYKI